MMADIQAVFSQYSDADINNMHPQTVAAKYQQAHRIERRRIRAMAIGVLYGRAPRHLEEIQDY